MKTCALLFWGSLVSTALGSIAPPDVDDDDTKQCTGLIIDFDRIQHVTKNDIAAVTQTLADSRSFAGADKGYGVNTIIPVVEQDTAECLFQRHRLQETKEGVPVFGADIVVTVQDCSPSDEFAFGGGYETSPLSGVPIQAISDLDGITFSNIDESEGYTPSKTKEEATQAIADYYEISTEKVGDLELIVFPSTVGDFLSYKSEVIVAKPGNIQLYDVIISAHTLELLSICKKTSAHAERIERRNLRSSENRNLQVNCLSCAASRGISAQSVEWLQEEVQCPIKSLYLDDTNKTTICVKGTLNGQEVHGPGGIPELHYSGTYDCMESDTVCYANPLPSNCSDALSDVHYGIVQTLQLYRDYVGVKGGLSINENKAESFSSYVHYGQKYCNAFFTTQTNDLFFGKFIYVYICLLRSGSLVSVLSFPKLHVLAFS